MLFGSPVEAAHALLNKEHVLLTTATISEQNCDAGEVVPVFQLAPTVSNLPVGIFDITDSGTRLRICSNA